MYIYTHLYVFFNLILCFMHTSLRQHFENQTQVPLQLYMYTLASALAGMYPLLALICSEVGILILV